MMERYEKYKDSGVEWIGEIPVGWEVKKLKYSVLKVGSGITPKGGANVYQLSGIPLLRSQNIHFEGLWLNDVAYISQETHDMMANSKVQSGDVLLNITGASIGRCFYVDDQLGEANVNQHVCIIRPKKPASTKFLYFVLMSDIGQSQIYFEQIGSGREGLNFEALNNFVIPDIKLKKQIRIADFLEHKTAKIDELIAQKECLIKLYEEEKAAIINQAVTKGIDPDAKLKDSGVDWLGEIPEGWEVTALKRLVIKITDGEHISPKFTQSGMPFLSAKDVRDGYVQIPDDKFVDYEDGLRFRRRCDPEFNDILLVSRGATVGRVAVIDTNVEFCLLGSVILLKPTGEILSLYLFYSLKNKLVQEYFLHSSQSSAQQAIYLEKVATLFLAIPTIEEQSAIVGFIEKEIVRIDAKITKTKCIIELQKEYRTALISEVVTGKLDVRDEVTV
jgi:type I restriction enzyme, S subunit